MIAYFDTSGFVPLLIEEQGSSTARDLWRSARMVISTRLLYVEAAAALRRAESTGRIDRANRLRAEALLDGFWSEVAVRELNDPLMRSAASVASELGLRGFDAVHCAAAHSIASPRTVAVAGDRRLLRAWQSLGLSTAAV